MMQLDTIPAEMKAYPNWICFRLEPNQKDPAKMDKIPYTPGTEYHASTTKKSTWRTFEEAVKHMCNYSGLGFVFTDSLFCGVDIDHCIGDDGELSERAKEVIANLDSYVERSVSGTGVHIITKAKLPGEGRKASRKGFDDVEIYDTGRYFAVTGDTLGEPKQIADRQEETVKLWESLKPPAPHTPQKKPTQTPRGDLPNDAASIIERIRRSKSGDLFRTLFDLGDISRYNNDDSSADMGLMNMLPFWTKGDAGMMETIFRQSALATKPERQKKMARDDYIPQTVKAALKSWDGEIYDPTTYRANDDEIIPWSDETPAQGRNEKAAADMAAEEAESTGKKKIRLTDWKTGRNGNSAPVKKSFRNVQDLLAHHGWSVRKNLVSKELEVYHGGAKAQESLNELLLIVTTLCEKARLSTDAGFLGTALLVCGEKSAYSPVCDWLKECQAAWDGQDHIEEVFSCFTLADNQDPDLGKLLFRRWLISAVKLAFNERGDVHAQGIFTLQGAQGIGKTLFLSKLMPDQSFFAEGMSLDPRNKDDVLKVTRYWIVELGEFGETLRRDKLDALKSFVTSPRDIYRKPYGRFTEDEPRRTAFFATVNDEQFLKDPTGDRRYWVLGVKAVDLDRPLNICQLWGQIAHLALVENEPHYLTGVEIADLNESNKRFSEKAAEERVLLDMLDWETPTEKWSYQTATELCYLLNYQPGYATRMSKAIRQLAKEDARIKLPTNNMRKVYLLPPVK